MPNWMQWEFYLNNLSVDWGYFAAGVFCVFFFPHKVFWKWESSALIEEMLLKKNDNRRPKFPDVILWRLCVRIKENNEVQSSWGKQAEWCERGKNHSVLESEQRHHRENLALLCPTSAPRGSWVIVLRTAWGQVPSRSWVRTAQGQLPSRSWVWTARGQVPSHSWMLIVWRWQLGCVLASCGGRELVGCRPPGQLTAGWTWDIYHRTWLPWLWGQEAPLICQAWAGRRGQLVLELHPSLKVWQQGSHGGGPKCKGPGARSETVRGGRRHWPSSRPCRGRGLSSSSSGSVQASVIAWRPHAFQRGDFTQCGDSQTSQRLVSAAPPAEPSRARGNYPPQGDSRDQPVAPEYWLTGPSLDPKLYGPHILAGPRTFGGKVDLNDSFV